MKKLVILILALCLIVPPAAMAAGEKGFKVAVSNSFITHSWRTQMVNNLQKRIALYEVKVGSATFRSSMPDRMSICSAATSKISSTPKSTY